MEISLQQLSAVTYINTYISSWLCGSTKSDAPQLMTDGAEWQSFSARRNVKQQQQYKAYKCI